MKQKKNRIHKNGLREPSLVRSAKDEGLFSLIINYGKVLAPSCYFSHALFIFFFFFFLTKQGERNHHRLVCHCSTV